MTTTELISRLRKMSIKWKALALWQKDEWRVMKEAADRLNELRAKADPKWFQWMIMDEGLFLVGIKDGESDWTEHKDDAMAFGVREEAEKFLDEHFMETGGGQAVLRGDVEACSNFDFFMMKINVSSCAKLSESVGKGTGSEGVSSYNTRVRG